MKLKVGTLTSSHSSQLNFGTDSSKIRRYFQDWQNAFYQLFKQNLDENTAQNLAKISVADYEGAILMYRLNNDLFYLDQIKSRILQTLNQ